MGRLVVGLVFLSLVCSGGGFLAAEAAPPHPRFKERLLATGEYEAFLGKLAQARQEGWDQPNPQPFRLSPLALAGLAVDTLKVVVLLVDFSDNQMTAGFANANPDTIQKILFSRGYIASGSMAEYYDEVSLGKLYVTGQVFGPFHMDSTYAYYVNNNGGLNNTCPRCARQLTRDAIAKADTAVNFSQFDGNGDGRVDGLIIMHAGQGAEEGGISSRIYSHFSNTGFPADSADGKSIPFYIAAPEEAGYAFPAPGLVTIGVPTHEFGHNLGLPDLYDVDDVVNGRWRGLGDWSLMASGNYLGDGIYSGRKPGHLDPWSKIRLGFAAVDTVRTNRSAVPIPAVETSEKIFRLWIFGGTGPQYFLVENRRKKLFDTDLPGSGLLIYHVDETVIDINLNPYNGNPSHPFIVVEQADGRRQMETDSSDGDAGDPYPGTTNHRTFDDLSNPNSRNYLNQSTQVEVLNVSNSADTMAADLNVRWSRPLFQFSGTSVNDSINGNPAPNLRADSGETVELMITLKDLQASTDSVRLRLRSQDTLVSVSDSVGFIPAIAGSGGQASNTGDRFVVTIDPRTGRSRLVNFLLCAWSKDSSITLDTVFHLAVGPTDILIVDDDTGKTYETYYEAPFDSLRIPYDVWHKKTQGRVDSLRLRQYPKVVWFTGDRRCTATCTRPLTVNDIIDLKAYLNTGGKLFLTGQDIAQSLAGTADSTFLRDYLHCRYFSTGFPFAARGVLGDPVTGFIDSVYFGAPPDGAGNQQSPDLLTPGDSASAVFKYTPSGQVAGTRFKGQWQTVFFAFGFEAISSTRSGYNTRMDVMNAVMNWFDTGAVCALLGDASGDRVVDIVDLVVLVNYVVFGSPIPTGINCTELTGDGVIDILDIICLLNYVVFGNPIPCG